MHKGNREWLTSLRKAYPEHFTGARVLEIGAYDVNGTARDYFHDAQRYVGVDQTMGPCVDVVCPASETSFRPGEFDTLVYLSVFEHDPRWENGFRHNLQWIREGGLIIVGWGAEGNVRHDPEPWSIVPIRDFMEAASAWPIQIVEAFFERERFDPGCAGAFDLLARKTTHGKLPLDSLSDEALRAINTRHAWVTGTADSRGRILGRPERVLSIPDSKVAIARNRIGLSGKTVVEFGCLEGAHTVALCLLAKQVIALEARDDNIARTRIRCGLYGVVPEILKSDLEINLPPSADVFFHSGVLYHLKDPVGHLLNVSPLTDAMLLDTHYADTPREKYVCPNDKKTYRCLIYREDVHSCKSGMRSFSRWLGLTDLVGTLKGRFKRVEVVDDRQERNGRRATIVAMEKIR